MIKKLIEKITYCLLLVYYVIDNDSTSKKYKAMIIGAIVYFFVPIDLVPDFVPIVGYTDDLAAAYGLFWAVKRNVNPQVKQNAIEKIDSWFDKK